MSDKKKEELELDISEIERKEWQTKPDCRDVAVQHCPDWREIAVQTHGEASAADTTGR